MSQLTKPYTFSTGVFEDLLSNGPGSVEIYDTQAGEVDACLNSAVNNVILRSHIPQFWKAFVPQVETLTGTERVVNADATAKAKAKAKPDAKVSDILEGWNPYITRVWAGADDVLKAKLNTLAFETAASLEISVAPASREGSGQSKALAPFFANADKVLALEVDLRESKLTKLLAIVGDFDLERDTDGVPDRTSLAKLFKAWNDKMTADL